MGIKTRIRNLILKAVRNSDWYKKELFQDCEKFWNQSDFNLEVVNLGSTSAVRAFDYEGLPLKAANWALSRNYLFGDKAILENYSSYLSEKGSTVIIPLCAFSSLSGSYTYLDDRYYTILYPSSIPGFSKNRQMAIRELQSNPLPHYPMWQLYLDIRKKLTSLIRKSKPSIPSGVVLDRNASQWVSDWKREFSLKDFISPLTLINQDAVKDAIGLLNDIITFCKEHNHRPILVFPPMHRSLSAKFSAEARELLIGSMVKALDNRDVKFLDYMDDAEFADDASLFENAYLMNAKGAKQFTKRVMKDVGLL